MGKLWIRGIFLGFGLSMDAGAVSITNGMNYKDMLKHKMIFMSFLFGIFQGGMPLIGYWVGRAILKFIHEYLSWFALGILGFLGLNMILSSFEKEVKTLKKLNLFSILMQAIATSIDALSVGITIANYTLLEALITAGWITGITFTISFLGILLGKRFGTRFNHFAEGLGGVILIGIGIEIFLKGRRL